MIEELNARLNAIWTDAALAEPNLLVPMYFGTLARDTIVFVGFNPSFGDDRTADFFRSKNREFDSIRAHYSWRNHASFDHETDRQFSQHSRQNYAFFAQHRALAERLGLRTWEHLDLFHFRETNQETGLELLARNVDFRDFQLSLFESSLEYSSPKAVIVANAKASEILKDRWQLGDVSPESGCHYKVIAARSTPIFFSGMLTGQRALDVHSRERLFWHVSKVLIA